MTATVIVVSYNNDNIDLRWVPNQADVHVVVNGGRRPDLFGVQQVTWHEPGSNLGFGAAVNLVAFQVETDRLVVVNPDCTGRTEHWGPLADARYDDVVTVPLASSDGRLTTVVSRYPGPLAHVASALRLRNRLRARMGEAKWLSQSGGLGRGRRAPLATHWVSGACFSVDRRRFTSIGGFDERFFLYYEDLDLCRRLAVRYPESRAVVADVAPGVHRVGASGSRTPANVQQWRAASAHLVAQQHRGWAWSLARSAIGRHYRRLSRRSVTPIDVAVLHLGRDSAMGERRRVDSWLDIASAGGLRAAEVPLLGIAPRRSPIMLLTDLVRIARGQLVPEALSWSAPVVRRWLEASGAKVVVCTTSRAYHPSLHPGVATLVLDFVDELSASYEERARESPSRPRRAALRLLANRQHHFERRSHPADRLTAAGWRDCEVLGAHHVPVTTKRARIDARSEAADHDLVFVGTLSYPPNIAAVRVLDRHWRQLAKQRPGTTLMIAGARPVRAVVEMARRNGWTLQGDFPDEATVYGRCRVAIVPLVHARGMQIKVKDALIHGLPVVATSEALAGYHPSLPLEPVPVDQVLTRAAQLLDEPERSRAQVEDIQEWIAGHMAPEHFLWALSDPAAEAST